jgi:hypothetical protein
MDIPKDLDAPVFRTAQAEMTVEAISSSER